MCWIVTRSNQWQDDDGNARPISDTLVKLNSTNSSTSNLIVTNLKNFISLIKTVNETKRVEGNDLAEEKSNRVYARQHNWDLKWFPTQYGWNTS